MQVTNVTKVNCCSVDFILESKFIALFVLFEIDIVGYFSDNAFMTFESTMQITFISSQHFTLDKFHDSIQLKSLYNVYN